MLTFEEMGLSSEILLAIEEMGFKKPTPIQEKFIPAFFEEDNDIVGLAQTGTGKTAAFGLPIIEQIDVQNKSAQALILAPTRELCIQISKDLTTYASNIKGLHVVPVYGGASIDIQMRALKRGSQIIAATPGRMLDLIKRKSADISNISTVVLDEADEMLNMGFRDELDAILEQTPNTKRTLLFSATMPNEVARIAKNYMHNPIQITVGKQNAGAENIQHIYYQVHARDRYLALKRIADMNPNIYGIVFCRTRMETKEVADKLIKDGYNADAIHGDLSQAQRDQVMNRFREKSLQMLVATDVAARGIDVDDITHIINYNLPEELEVYTHRSGRTGRAGKSGVSIAIVNYREINRIPRIEKIIQKKFNRLPIPNGPEICKKQLFQLIDNMENVMVDEDQIAPFMETVNKKLEWLTKEQIIKRFVSLEFNRFLEYYKNAPDLNKSAESNKGSRDGRGERGKHGKHGERGDRSERRSKRGRVDYARFFINVGKKDHVEPKNIIGMVNDNTQDRDISIGTIDIKEAFSFFEVEKVYTEKVLKSFDNTKYKGRDVHVNLAKERNSADKGRRMDKEKKKDKRREKPKDKNKGKGRFRKRL